MTLIERSFLVRAWVATWTLTVPRVSWAGGGGGDLPVGSMLVIGFFVLVLAFLAFREVNCWYWKINERLDVELAILKTLRSIDATLSRTPTASEGAGGATAAGPAGATEPPDTSSSRGLPAAENASPAPE